MLTHSSSPCCQRSCADNTAPLLYYKIITVPFQKATGAWTHWHSQNSQLLTFVCSKAQSTKMQRNDVVTLWRSWIVPVCMCQASTRSIAFTTISPPSAPLLTPQHGRPWRAATRPQLHTQHTRPLGNPRLNCHRGNNWFNGHVDS